MSGKSVSSSRRRKRTQPPVYSGISTSYEDKDNDFICPICFDTIEEAHMTKCGHSFCLKCIKLSLQESNRCPKCNFVIEKPDQIFPNFSLNELVLKHRQKVADQKRLRLSRQNGFSEDAQDLLVDHEGLDLAKVEYLMDMLNQKKQKLEGDCKIVQNQILKEFLQQVRDKKQQQMDQLNKELGLIDEDMQKVEVKAAEHRLKFPSSGSPDVPNGIDPVLVGNTEQNGQDGFNGSRSSGHQWLQTTMASRRKKVHQHFDDLEQCYFNLRHRDLLTNGISQTEPTTSSNSSTSLVVCNGPTTSSATSSGANSPEVDTSSSLEDFQQSLSKFTRYSTVRPLATLSYASDIYNTSSIVSSIEFDRDCDYFAIAGVTKKIKVFEYGTVIRDAVDMHYPVNEMVCNSKISSIIWSSYHKGMLASSDYEGTVTLWDAFTGVKSKIFQEHEKRCWSVDFNKMDPKLLASGSDDSKVKLWCTNMEHSVASLEAKANVCCVKFNPKSRYHLAFGSADHCVHYYDLRNNKQPLAVFKGHRKAVSYAKFVSGTEIVSASTDSQLKLWGTTSSHCLRTFKGHTNEKNFVGLASDGDYIACGSENNSLYIYYKGLSKHLLTFKFDTVRSVLERERREEDANEFVSAVCWRPDSNVVVAANSQGIIKVLELV